MVIFGLHQRPMLFALTTGIGLLPANIRSILRKILPYFTLFFGMFLVYRGLVINMPGELDF